MKKFLLLSATLLITTLAFTACAFFGGSDGINPEKCVVITPSSDADNDSISYVAERIKVAFLDAHEAKIGHASDAEGKKRGTNEVLIGKTDRALSAEAIALLPTDIDDDIHAFSILIKDGDIAIAASNDVAYKIAGRYFIDNVLRELPNELTLTKFTTETIRAEEGLGATCYELSSLNTDIFIESVTYGKKDFDAFDALTTSYLITLELSDTLHEVKINHPSFISSSAEWVSDTQYNITLSSKDKSKTVTYSFNYDRLEYDFVKGAKVEKVLGGKDAIVVIVHDDGTKSTVEYMVESFKMNGLVGTLGLVTHNLASKGASGEWVLNKTEVDYWKNVLKSGVFDVASHSHTHSFWGVSDEAESGWYLDSGNNLHQYSFPAGKITEEVAGSREILKLAFPNQDVLAFIKPGFGRVSDEDGTRGMAQISDKAYEIIKENYICMRDTDGGVNPIPVLNDYKINSFVIRGSQTSADWEAAVEEAKNTNGLLVFLFHTITEEPAATSLSGKMSEADVFFDYLGTEKELGNVWNTHLEDAVMYTQEYAASKFEARDDGEKIEIILTNSLDENIYNQPLTVTVPVEDGVTAVTVKIGASERTLDIITEGGERFVRFDLIPNTDSVYLYMN